MAFPAVKASNFRIRQTGERQAMNAGIQGLAADIFKVALIRLDAALVDQQLGSRLILQVHDEVILEVPPDEQEVAADLTLATMRAPPTSSSRSRSTSPPAPAGPRPRARAVPCPARGIVQAGVTVAVASRWWASL